jgi:protease-4
MFSRNHPFLFFLLIMGAIGAFALIVLTLIVAVGIRGFQGTPLRAGGGDLVGIVEVTGIIYDSDEIVRQIKGFREDDAIRAILLRINSPGGTVGPAQEIFREIQKTIDHKKVVVSMGTVAASGGYYIAAAADGIMANPGTITGSIGVIMSYTNYQQLFEKIGLAPVVIKSGEFKDIGSPMREMTEAEEDILQDFVDKTRRQFVEAVAAGRDLPLETVAALADGRMYTGEEAMEHDLVDKLGNLEDAIEWAGRMAGIEGDISVVYARKEKFSLLDILLGTAQESLLQNLSQYLQPQAAYLLDVREESGR